MYSNIFLALVLVTIVISTGLLLDDTWYITKDIYSKSGNIRSGQKAKAFIPELSWEYLDQSYFDNDFENCKTFKVNDNRWENVEKETRNIYFYLLNQNLLLTF